MAKISFNEYLQSYKEWRAKEMGDKSRLSEAEIAKVRADFQKKIAESKARNRRPAMKEATNVKTDSLQEALKQYAAYKATKSKEKMTEAERKAVTKEYHFEKYAEYKKNVMKDNSPVTLKEKKAIIAELEKGSSKFAEACAQYKSYKVNERHDNSPLTATEKAKIKEGLKVDAINEKLKEAKKLVVKAKYRLHEGDMMGAADMTQQAGGAVNQAADMTGDANTPASPLPQNIIDEISNIKTSVDTLAQEIGIESPVDLGADATAGVDGVTGVGDPNAAGAADPNAQAGLMPESLSATAKRIAAREARLNESSSIADAVVGIEKKTYSGIKANGGNTAENKLDKSTSEELVKVPGTASLLSGTATGPASKEMKPANRWPTKPLKDAPMTKKLGNIEESDETENEDEKLEESDSWAEKRVAETMNKPRFNWNDYLNSSANLTRR